MSITRGFITGTVCVALAFILTSTAFMAPFQGVQAQESEKRDPQPGLLGEDVDKQIHDSKEPIMMVRLHKKPKTLKKRWRFVDLDARKEAEVADYDKAIEEAKKAEEEGRIEELTQRKIQRVRAGAVLALRRVAGIHQGIRGQFMRVEVKMAHSAYLQRGGRIILPSCHRTYGVSLAIIC